MCLERKSLLFLLICSFLAVNTTGGFLDVLCDDTFL